jgi:hypothetical protein
MRVGKATASRLSQHTLCNECALKYMPLRYVQQQPEQQQPEQQQPEQQQPEQQAKSLIHHDDDEVNGEGARGNAMNEEQRHIKTRHCNSMQCGRCCNNAWQR